MRLKSYNPVVIALVLWFLFCALNAFTVIKSTYPEKPTPPDQIMVISDSGVGPLPETASKRK